MVVATAVASQVSPAASLVPRFGQEAVCQAVSKLFPEEIFRQFRFPMIEDLVILAPSWLCEQELAWDGALVLACQQCDSGKGRWMGSRLGPSLPPLLPFGLSPDEHFQCALAKACEPTPFKQVPVLDTDLMFMFAAQVTAQHRDKLRKIRWRLKELHRRWRPVGAAPQNLPDGGDPAGDAAT